MKIKVDHVTNSSSEVFGVVVTDSAVTLTLMFMLDQALEGIRMTAPSEQSRQLSDEVVLECEKAADRVASGVMADARQQEKIVTDAYQASLTELGKVRTEITNAMSQAQKDFDVMAKTANPSDPSFIELKTKHEFGLNFCKEQLRQLDLQKAAIEKQKRGANDLINERDAWIQQNQSDYVTVKEQKALLDSLGSSVKSGDVNPWLEAYKELEKREIDIDKALSSANAKLEYDAIKRGKIEPDPKTLELMKAFEDAKAEFEKAIENADEKTRKTLRITYEKKADKIRQDLLEHNRAALAQKASEGIQYGADVALDGLADLAGPAGAQIKVAYTAIKTVIAGAKDAKKDPKNKSKHLAKAILNASFSVFKDQLGDIPYGKEASTVVNNLIQSSLSASIAGTSTAQAVGTSLSKSLFDLGGEKGIAALKDATGAQKKEAEASVIPLTVVEVLNDNPLTDKLSEHVKGTLIFE